MIASEKPIPIYTGTDFYVPHFQVKVGNRQQSSALVRDVIQVSYKDSLDQLDSFELTVNNWCAESRKFKYHDRRLFDPGQPVELEMGYLGAQGGGLRTMIRGEITDLRLAFPSGGQPTLVVAGQNILHRFRSEQRSEKYTEVSYTEIAARVCKRISVPFVPVKSLLPEPRPDSIIQNNEYDLVFLTRLARMAGYELVVSEAKGQAALTFGPPSTTARPTYELIYGRTLIEFQPTISFAKQVSEVVVRGFDPAKGEEIEVTVGGGSLDKKVAPGARNPAKGRKEVLAQQPVRDKKAAQELAHGTLTGIHNDAVTATGSVVGLPDLRAGCQIHIRGVGERFNGRYVVKSTTHNMGTSGYTTQFECRLEELSKKSDGESLKD